MSGSASSAKDLDRVAVWKLLGAPADQLGSVNDPRTAQEQGLCWNEKWIYRDAELGHVIRVVLWNRYDLVGAFRVDESGVYAREPLGDG
jgi:hypothetical protein